MATEQQKAMLPKMKHQLTILAEVIVTFDEGQAAPKRLRVAEIGDEIEGAVSGCSQIENVAAVRVSKLTVETPKPPVRVWQIGPDGTEFFAAYDEAEIKRFYRQMFGSKEKKQANQDLAHHFQEVTDLDQKFEFNDDGEKKMTTWRQLAESAGKLPCQISTGYN